MAQPFWVPDKASGVQLYQRGRKGGHRPALQGAPSSRISSKARHAPTSAMARMEPIRVTRLKPQAFLPKRARAGDAGYDLCASERGSVPPGSWSVIKTGLALAVPPGCCGRVAPRSGLAAKKGITTGAGVIGGYFLFSLIIIGTYYHFRPN